jgi:hypothetical protein
MPLPSPSRGHRCVAPRLAWTAYVSKTEKTSIFYLGDGQRLPRRVFNTPPRLKMELCAHILTADRSRRPIACRTWPPRGEAQRGAVVRAAPPLARRVEARLRSATFLKKTLYKEQWLKLLDMSADIRAFIAANEAQLKAKD